MGKHKSKSFVILLPLLAFTISTCCIFGTQRYAHTTPAIVITGISWIENTIEISFTRYGESELEERLVVYYRSFDGGINIYTKIVEEYAEDYNGYRGVMIIDLTDVPIAVIADVERIYNDSGWLIYKPTFVINEEAEFWLQEKGGGKGGVIARVFVGEDRIYFLSQRYYHVKWRY